MISFNISSLPEDVELMICRYVHEMNMNEVLPSLKEDFLTFNLVFNYLQRRTFYPYLIRHRLYKSDFFTKISSKYLQDKVYKYIHYKLLSRCLLDISRMGNQHIIFEDV